MQFLPHDEKFFELLVAQIKIVFEASSVLAEGLGGTNTADAGGIARKIRELEKSGDIALRQIYQRLHKTFITPIDPEDIHELATRIEEILDHLESVAFRIDSYGMGRLLGEMPEVARMLHGCIAATRNAIEVLERDGVKKPEELTKCCQEINRRELAIEDKVRELVRELFAKESDAIALMKQKELYELLESTADCCEDVADVLEAISVKNS